MKKNVLIFLEGVPGAGKSTLAKNLATRLDLAIYPRNPAPGVKHAFFSENTEILRKVEHNTIFDRFFWSDVVFSSIYKVDDFQQVMEQFEEIHRLLAARHQYVLVYVKNPNAILRQQHSSFSALQIREMEFVYEELLDSEVSSNLCVIDYSEETLESAAAKIERFYYDKVNDCN